MENSKKIQIGLLGLIAVLLLLNITGVFDGVFGKNDTDVRNQASQNLVTNSSGAANTVSPTAPGAVNPLANNPAATPPKPVEPPVPAGPPTTMTFEKLVHDFGTIDEGEVVTHAYKFKNTGNEPLTIAKCKGSCGCTVPKCPTAPILPGESGEIEVKFDSKGKKNKQTKQVTITANTENPTTILKITGEVTPDPNAPAKPAKPAGAAPTIVPAPAQ